MAGKGVWAIWKSKTSRHGFLIQHVVLSDDLVVSVVRVLRQVLARSSPLLPYSQEVYGTRLAQLLAVLGVPAKLFSLGSIRGGGATEDWIMRENLGRVQFRGRWKNPNSVQHYMQEATACLATLQFSRRTQTLVASLEGLVSEIFPPSAAQIRRSRD